MPGKDGSDKQIDKPVTVRAMLTFGAVVRRCAGLLLAAYMLAGPQVALAGASLLDHDTKAAAEDKIDAFPGQPEDLSLSAYGGCALCADSRSTKEPTLLSPVLQHLATWHAAPPVHLLSALTGTRSGSEIPA